MSRIQTENVAGRTVWLREETAQADNTAWAAVEEQLMLVATYSQTARYEMPGGFMDSFAGTSYLTLSGMNVNSGSLRIYGSAAAWSLVDNGIWNSASYSLLQAGVVYQDDSHIWITGGYRFDTTNGAVQFWDDRCASIDPATGVVTWGGTLGTARSPASWQGLLIDGHVYYINAGWWKVPVDTFVDGTMTGATQISTVTWSMVATALGSDGYVYGIAYGTEGSGTRYIQRCLVSDFIVGTPTWEPTVWAYPTGYNAYNMTRVGNCLMVQGGRYGSTTWLADMRVWDLRAPGTVYRWLLNNINSYGEYGSSLIATKNWLIKAGGRYYNGSGGYPRNQTYKLASAVAEAGWKPPVTGKISALSAATTVPTGITRGRAVVWSREYGNTKWGVTTGGLDNIHLQVVRNGSPAGYLQLYPVRGVGYTPAGGETLYISDEFPLTAGDTAALSFTGDQLGELSPIVTIPSWGICWR